MSGTLPFEAPEMGVRASSAEWRNRTPTEGRFLFRRSIPPPLRKIRLRGVGGFGGVAIPPNCCGGIAAEWRDWTVCASFARWRTINNYRGAPHDARTRDRRPVGTCPPLPRAPRCRRPAAGPALLPYHQCAMLAVQWVTDAWPCGQRIAYRESVPLTLPQPYPAPRDAACAALARTGRQFASVVGD